MKLYVDILKQEVKPALGCTEPIAVALAVAKACETIGDPPLKVEVEVSANILKNGMGVGIPGTGMIGLDIAVAISMICGKSEYGLEVLKDVCPEFVDEISRIIDNNMVKITLSDSEEKLYIVACAISENHSSKVIITDRHDNISYVELDGKEVELETKKGDCVDDASVIIDTRAANMTIENIFRFIQDVDIEDIRFILEAKELNMILANEGLNNDYGLKVGKTLFNKMGSIFIGSSLMTYSMSLTAAASDARMAGCSLPAMSNSGSGNQGITVTMPVVAAAERMNVSEEELIRALALSHLCAIHIKSHLGRLSALCGCVVASSGAACGITYLNGGGYSQICASLKNMIANITGMVCDGAKVGCALKVATGVSCAVQASMLALDDICVSSKDGIIDDDIEKTISNLGIIGIDGMGQTDKEILKIMINKC